MKSLRSSSGKRSGVAPDVPTVAEVAGIAGFDITLWQGFFAPRGTPVEVVARLNTEINKILAEPNVKQKLLEQGADISPMSIDQFSSFVKADRFTAGSKSVTKENRRAIGLTPFKTKIRKWPGKPNPRCMKSRRLPKRPPGACWP